MSFHLTSSDLRVESHDGRSYLVGRATRADGSHNDVRLDLDGILGNDNGHFQWDGENFTGSARNVSFSIEGGGAVPVLRAELQNAEGHFQGADVNLSERVENVNGDLVFQ
ncbi:hypothetical protein Q9L58_010618 [Maublancomyces gigas]|uniref:Cyanovirin-N domain-containing protein n=1 Tax=Discina gigas TaxID=1032678 RepID=A0ABR3G421_9PEZI